MKNEGKCNYLKVLDLCPVQSGAASSTSKTPHPGSTDLIFLEKIILWHNIGQHDFHVCVMCLPYNTKQILEIFD